MALEHVQDPKPADGAKPLSRNPATAVPSQRRHKAPTVERDRPITKMEAGQPPTTARSSRNNSSGLSPATPLLSSVPTPPSLHAASVFSLVSICALSATWALVSMFWDFHGLFETHKAGLFMCAGVAVPVLVLFMLVRVMYDQLFGVLARELEGFQAGAWMMC
ncbi:uncharacterized protein EKO05_0005732 [Ascochyta rabiei]|uniref:Uncharacterized protein n=1 Tax=Didymella rabiei TaxID=5454 RepID=A0A163LFI1_DIDRA|nr:uncharacterized protein EKO05_0005732 [Ascochyta rabiei]KZM27755.1 hypothetical protein ST47_g1097 [Ascochyta rabiei]UPX15278.1 hypothetical protein EKO05_0005732 [Ascochyta rabiei]